MHISLIGMSNSGKSYLSRKLKDEGFYRIGCDDIIERKLDLDGIHNVASWMGMPYERRYRQRSARYLEMEVKTMSEVLQQVSALSPDDNLVIDTTGSVIYTGDHILRQLALKTTVIYLDIPEHVKQEMYRSYIKIPKPVIWGDAFSERPNEAHQKALSRCYPQLLEYRISKYRQLAHMTLDYFWLRHPEWTINDLLQRLL